MTDATASFPIDAADVDVDADPASKRARRRDSLFLSGRLRIGKGEAIDIRIRNLSEGGLMAEGAPPLAIGAAVTVELRNLGAISGKIAWYVDDRAGVAFDVAIDPAKARKPVAVRAKPVPGRKTYAC